MTSLTTPDYPPPPAPGYSPNNVAHEDADLVAHLRAADAICLGKLNTNEFALGDMAVFGDARNPWDTTRTTGGSSAGPAGAVAAQLGQLAVGTDTGGSPGVPFVSATGRRRWKATWIRHAYFLHGCVNIEDPNRFGAYHADRAPRLFVVDTDCGVMYGSRRVETSASYYWRTTQLMPLITMLPADLMAWCRATVGADGRRTTLIWCLPGLERDPWRTRRLFREWTTRRDLEAE
jgi:hypothetical protein